ncbi:hypothetical protein JOC93_001352 [Priestia taiwanensis]|nr:hypothetical protein [Priestia taiwanensis]
MFNFFLWTSLLFDNAFKLMLILLGATLIYATLKKK